MAVGKVDRHKNPPRCLPHQVCFTFLSAGLCRDPFPAVAIPANDSRVSLISATKLRHWAQSLPLFSRALTKGL
jgi:hypothetical protein